MINLITGLPGACKTLLTISEVRKRAAAENRPVFYSGIPELNKEVLGWQEIDAEDWFKCPTGSIVIIDECQRVFRPRTIHKEIPEYVSKLETHRHQGIDPYLITQHPMLADSAIRRLTGNHRHIVRRFGMQSSTIHQWDGVKDQCEKPSSRVDSNKSVWGFDKTVFNLYKSAELHTVKRALPKRLIFVLAIPVAVGAAILYMYHFTHKATAPVPASPHDNSAFSSAGYATNSQTTYLYKSAKDDAKDYIYKETPRIAELPYSAPKYDKVTEPTIAPFPVGCVKTPHVCQCYSQQATPIKTTLETCERIVSDGVFEDFDVNGKDSREGADRQQIASASETSPAAVPVDHTATVTGVDLSVSAEKPAYDSLVHIVSKGGVKGRS